MTQPEETPVSFIPSNFIEKGKILNGTFDIRNAIESIVLSLAIGIPVFHLQESDILFPPDTVKTRGSHYPVSASILLPTNHTYEVHYHPHHKWSVQKHFCQVPGEGLLKHADAY